MNRPLEAQRRLACARPLQNLLAAMFAATLSAVAALAQSEQAATPDELEPPEAFGKLYHCKPGPWGDLEYYYIYLEAPDRVVSHMLRPDPTPKWCFPGGTEAKLKALFESVGLPNALQAYLLAPERRVLQDNVLTVFPPVPDLLAMSSEQRSAIYAELAKSDLNMLYVYPSYIPAGDVDAWLAQSGLRPQLSDAIKKLTYTRGEMLCFSDVAAILGMVESEREAHAVMKTLSRSRSLVVHLNVKSRLDFEKAVRYWSGDGRNEEIASIIFPAAEPEGRERLDCSHLLPALARRYLYTYPSEEIAISASMPDCYWTAFNFFSSAPLNYHTDVRMFLLHLNEDYTMVEPPYSFGDALMFVLPDGSPVHSCVYIADDIVYTKNGQNRASPWILSKLADVKRRYSHVQRFGIQGYRLKLQQDRYDE